MLTLIDNYDSFTYNLVHFLGELGASARVYRNDKVSVHDVLAEGPEAIVLSPGPCDPNRAGICLDLIERARSCRSLASASGIRLSVRSMVAA
jgi:anthranilate synthase component 2